MRILFGMRDDGDMTEPMNIMLLSALAKRKGHETFLWVIERDDIVDIANKVKPDIVAFSCITGSHKYYIDAAERLKKINKKIITIFGGPHFTFFPGEILIRDSIDYICVGEGDNAWPELLDAIENNNSPDEVHNIVTRNNTKETLVKQSDDLLQIVGVSNSGGDIPFDRYTFSPQRLNRRLVDLDDLPFMDRGLIYDNTDFINRYKRTLMASRGCPFRCTYCFEHQWNDLYTGLGTVRQFYTVDRFLDELEYIKKNWDTRFFKFYDDVMIPFPNPKEMAWHEEFCAKYPSRIGVPFHLLTRCDLVCRLLDKGVDVLSDWKKAGMASLTMSIESGNTFIRDHIIMRDMSGQEIERSFKHSYDLGIYTFPNVILGIPAPIIPHSIDEPDFDQKMQRVVVEIEILQKLNKIKIDLDKVRDLSKPWFRDDRDRKQYLLTFLRSAGLRSSDVDYDIESVKFTLAQRPGFPELPILAPFPKTQATNWAIARGDFDGDFDKLHASYQHKSPLTCYSEETKTIQQNLALTGSFLALFCGSRNRLVQLMSRPMQYLFIDKLSKIRSPLATKLYGLLYAYSKAYMHRKRIYPIKYTFRESLRFYTQMFTLDSWKQFRKKKKYRGDRPGQTLGGPASL